MLKNYTFARTISLSTVFAPFYALFILCLAVGELTRTLVTGISLAPVFWNVTSPIFKTSKNDHIIDVNPYDEIDFVCPLYSTMASEATLEYYIIYRVSKEEYEDCNIYSEANSLLILNCSHPRHKRRFTILFEPFQSIPNAPEYKAGKTYYFITTSTGKKQGLHNLYQGACLHHNMKLKIRIGHVLTDDDIIDYSLFADEDDELRDAEHDDSMFGESQSSSTKSTTSRPTTHARRHHHTRRPLANTPSTTIVWQGRELHSKLLNRQKEHQDKSLLDSGKNSDRYPSAALASGTVEPSRQSHQNRASFASNAASSSLKFISSYHDRVLTCACLLTFLVHFVLTSCVT